jgi:hypothetical protein
MNDDRSKSMQSLLVISVENVKITTIRRNRGVYLLFRLNVINGNNKRSETRLIVSPVTLEPQNSATVPAPNENGDDYGALMV